MDPGIAGIIVAVITAIIAPIAGMIGAAIGKKRARRGRLPGFDKLQSEPDLDNTQWKADFETVTDTGNAQTDHGRVMLRQYGSRVIGEVTDDDGRIWDIEGVACSRRLVYIYVDRDINRRSLGAALLTLDATGTKLAGKWTGATQIDLSIPLQNMTLTKIRPPIST